MKRVVLLSVLFGAMPLLSMAQDDLYFTPSKAEQAKYLKDRVEEDRPVYYSGIGKSNDEYNRRGQYSYKKVGVDSLGNDIFMSHVSTLHGDSVVLDTIYGGFTRQYESDNDDFAYSRALAFEAYQSPVYQVRMYGVFLFGYLSEDEEILHFMKEEVTKDENWRVQEILAKSFDIYCKNIGMENALPTIEEWLHSDNPNARRAVTEGLRIWTSRVYFKDHPEEAIRYLAQLKEDSSEYVRKSVGNALRDISKKFPDLIKREVETWSLDSKEIKQVYRLTTKL